MGLLAATGDLPDQTALDPAGRRALPADAFRATRPVPAAVVLVDDVRTTGATALAAAGRCAPPGPGGSWSPPSPSRATAPAPRPAEG